MLLHVTMRSPIPANPKKVFDLAPSFFPNNDISFKPRVISAAFVLSPYPAPSQNPAAIAITFFADPPISTPLISEFV